jgi:uncharacterized protein with NRDE domain
MSVFFVPLGRELPSARRKAIEKKAVRLEMKIAQNIRHATHVVISPDVQTMADVALAAMISEDALREMIEQVRLASNSPVA